MFPFSQGCETIQSRRMTEHDPEKDLLAEDKAEVIRRVTTLELLLCYAITQRLKRSAHIVAHGGRNLVADFLAKQSLN
jgi:hypothetical protein